MVISSGQQCVLLLFAGRENALVVSAVQFLLHCAPGAGEALGAPM